MSDNFVFFYTFFYCARWKKKFVQHIKHIKLNSPLLPFSFIPPPPFLEQFQYISLSHFHTFGHSICTTVTLPSPFHNSPSLHWYQPSQAGPVPPLDFLKEKKLIFLFKIATQEACCWHFHVFHAVQVSS
jgi:hypothetical protein